MKTDILCVPFDNITRGEAVERAMSMIQAHSGGYVVTPNPEIVLQCRENPALLAAVTEAELVLADGVGIQYGTKILGTPMEERIPGIDFASDVMARLGQQGGSIYLLGAKPGVADSAAAALAARFPGLQIAGTDHGYFEDDEPVVARIRAAKPDFLLVCLGAPKQECWMRDHAGAVDAGLMAGLGGCLDVFAGVVRRAPAAWQRLGLEWLYRLLREPKRLGRVLKLPKFLFLVLGERIRGKNDAR